MCFVLLLEIKLGVRIKPTFLRNDRNVLLETIKSCVILIYSLKECLIKGEQSLCGYLYWFFISIFVNLL